MIASNTIDIDDPAAVLCVSVEDYDKSLAVESLVEIVASLKVEAREMKFHVVSFNEKVMISSLLIQMGDAASPSVTVLLSARKEEGRIAKQSDKKSAEIFNFIRENL